MACQTMFGMIQTTIDNTVTVLVPLHPSGLPSHVPTQYKSETNSRLLMEVILVKQQLMVTFPGFETHSCNIPSRFCCCGTVLLCPSGVVVEHRPM